MSVLDRIGKVVKAEWGHRFGRSGRSDRSDRTDDDSSPDVDTRARERSATPKQRRATVVDVDGALRVLELSGAPSLADVRGQYQRLARRYHPKTTSASADEAPAARVVLEALTDALEVLEEHLLPLA